MSDPVVVLLSGPNLGLLGTRQPEIYGAETLADHVATASRAAEAHGLVLEHLQSEHEGDLVKAVHGARGRANAIIINAGALSHYGWSLRDALATFDGPIVELHLSNPDAREPWRHTSVFSDVATGSIAGFGGAGYALSVEAVARLLRAAVLIRTDTVEEMTITGDEVALRPMDVAGRLDRLRGAFDEAACDALVVSKRENVRYLSGFTGSAGTLVVRGDEAMLVTDSRYRDQAADEIASHSAAVSVEVVAGKAAFDTIGQFLETVGRVGLEADTCTWSQMRRYADLLDQAELVPTTGLVEGLRIVKDEGEIARIEKACEIGDVALAQVKERLRESITESEFAAELEFEMHRRGSSGPSFSTIVASGPHSAMPHARPSQRQIVEGDLVVVDFGATVDGYRSDMTRTFAIGDIDRQLIELVEAVFASQRSGLLTVSASASGAEVDQACRKVLDEAGLGEHFLHSTGHGVGLEIHEAPWVAAGSADILPADTVVTVEPGAYLSGRGGVRIEDTVVVTSTGARILTKSTKDYTL